MVYECTRDTQTQVFYYCNCKDRLYVEVLVEQCMTKYNFVIRNRKVYI